MRVFSNVRRDESWVAVRQTAAQAKVTIEKSKYLFIYAMPAHVEIPDDEIDTNKKEDVFWKRSEVIRIGSKSHVCTYQLEGYPPSICYCSDPQTHASYTEIGLSFSINFSNEFVRGEEIVQKSEAFRKVTASLLAMLHDEFVSWRSPHCFDDPNVNIRVFGERFKNKARVKAKR